jgi:hypothetical protein
MKKILMIAAMMVATIAAKAQFEPGTFSLQPKVGFNLSEISAKDSKFKAGLVAGLEGQYQINNWFALSAGLLYTQEGTKIKDSELKFNLEYLNIPVMAKFYVAKGLSLNAGLQLGFMTKGKLKGNGYNDDIKSICNKADFSIPLSIAYEFTNGLSFEARYTGGLTNVIKEETIREAGMSYKWEKDNKNKVFMLTIDYKIDL